MEKIAINTERLQFCCDMLSIDINKLYQDINIWHFQLQVQK
jgi:hypothetical protein